MRAALAALALSGCAVMDAPVDPAFADHDVRTSVVLAKATELDASALADHPKWDGSFSIDGVYRLELKVRRVLAGPDPSRGSRTIEVDTVAHAYNFSGKTLTFLIRTDQSGEVLGFSPWTWPDTPCFWPEAVKDTEVEPFFADRTGDKWCIPNP